MNKKSYFRFALAQFPYRGKVRLLSYGPIAGFLNQLHPNKKLMNQLDFGHVDIDSRKMKDLF